MPTNCAKQMSMVSDADFIFYLYQMFILLGLMVNV
jgi:hypothetical protein